MCLVWRKRRVLCILDQVIALRSERSQNIWTGGSLVPRHQAVSYYQLACAVGNTVPDTATTLAAGIAIDSAKEHLRLGNGTTVEDATTRPLSSIIRDRTVDQPERPTSVGYTTPTVSHIPRDGAVDEGESSVVIDAATTPISRISRDRAVDEGESSVVIDAATITSAP